MKKRKVQLFLLINIFDSYGLPAELRGGWARNDEYMMCRSSWGVGYPSWELTPENISKIRGGENLFAGEAVTGGPLFSICNILLLSGPETGMVRVVAGGAHITRPVQGPYLPSSHHF